MKMSKLALMLSSCVVSGFAFANSGFNNSLAIELQNELRMAAAPHQQALVLQNSNQIIQTNPVSGSALDAVQSNEFVQAAVLLQHPYERSLQPNVVSIVPDLNASLVTSAASTLTKSAALVQVAQSQNITVTDSRNVAATDAITDTIAHFRPDTQVNLSANAATSLSKRIIPTSADSDLAQYVEDDKLQELTRALTAGQHQPQAKPLTQAEKQQELNLKLRSQRAQANLAAQATSQVIEFNNATLNKKYPVSSASFNSSVSSSAASWLEKYPLPKNIGRVSSTFGSRVMDGRVEHHQGLDLAAPTGTPIYATGSGMVTKAGWGTGYGQYVEINHGSGYLTRYGHASSVNVQVGDRVNAGDHIANVGCTGRCTGPHLHYEVVKDGERRNPVAYLALLP